MPLEVLKNGKREVYQEGTKLCVNQWSKALGLSAVTVEAALYRQGLRPEEGPPRFPNQPNQLLIPIDRFPEIIRGLARVKMIRRMGQDPEHRHPWTAVDTTQNFRIINHKGTALKYLYPKGTPSNPEI